MQNITIIGRLGKQAEVHSTKNGKQFVAFSVAVNSKRGSETKTTWYEVISFNEQHVGKLVQYLTKGSSIVVVGELDAEAQLGKNGQAYMRLAVIADRIDFTSSGSGDAMTGSTNSLAERVSSTDDEFSMGVGTPTPQPQAVAYAAPAASTLQPAENEDLPF